MKFHYIVLTFTIALPLFSLMGVVQCESSAKDWPWWRCGGARLRYLPHASGPWCEGYNLNWLHNPEVEFKWQMSGSSGWYLEGQDSFHHGVSFQNNKEEVIVSASVASLLLICSAHYPVYWTYHLQMNIEQGNSPTTYLHRISEDFQDPLAYKFYAYLVLPTPGNERVSTGRYICKGVRAMKDELRTKRFIFSEGAKRSMVYGEAASLSSFTAGLYGLALAEDTPVCTTPSCKGLPSKTVQADKDNQTIILPCAVNSPHTQLKLYKRFGSTTEDYNEVDWTKANATAGITFDPKVGFILNVTEQVTSPYGIYKCTHEIPGVYYRPDSNEVLIVNVTTGLAVESKGENDTLSENAKYFYDASAHEKFGDRIVCCSNGTKPPRIYTKYCSTKYECRTIRKQLQDFWYLDESDIRTGNCRSSVVLSAEPLVTGVFRCVGDGIDVTREYYIPQTTSIEQNLNQSAIYYDDEISGLDKLELITFSASEDGNGIVATENEIFTYTNQSLHFTCHPSTYLFALGVRWSITWRNKTSQLVPTTGAYVISEYIGAELTDDLQIRASKDILSVTCHAPLYDTFEWFNKTLRISVSDGEAPKIIGPETVRFHWVIGADKNKTLSCEASGDPAPTFSWTEPMSPPTETYYTFAVSSPGERWREYDSNREIVREETNSTLRFKEILLTMEGTYTCLASSIPDAGTVTKTFIVSVSDEAETQLHETQQSKSESKQDHDGPNQSAGMGTGTVILLCVGVSIVTFGALMVCVFIYSKNKIEGRKRLEKMSYQDLKEIQE